MVADNELNEPSSLMRNISILPELKAHTYFSSSEKTNGSNLIFCFTIVKSVQLIVLDQML